MVRKDERILWNKGRLAFGLTFFLFCYIYLWIVVKPHLIYHGYGTLIPDIPEFAAGWRFWVDSLSLPGGLVQYGVGLSSQGYYESWLGALLIALVALCLYELSRRHYSYIHHSASTILPFFPAVMIVLITNHYDHPLAACLTSFAGLLLSLGFEKIPIRSLPVRMVFFSVVAAIGYWFAGAGGVFVFSLMTGSPLSGGPQRWVYGPFNVFANSRCLTFCGSQPALGTNCLIVDNLLKSGAEVQV